ncbi:hypothetical protein OXPF_06910 [Oxobacter pfennigii]|uniref:Uncharacterized protein n=1 Tax=Oxobacter pfennigii TaxID=36849 RepID=A0A0P8WCJ1_9CLOT|nr:hypothetical protein [Oxobacter pfennigii]KPU45458.1 hypothetical protein OXPF_06910 [Oxobacter pfennigii]
MRYLTYELWNRINSDLAKEREKSHLQWSKGSKEYPEIFENIKHRLPKKILNVYMKEHRFHDFHLKDFQIIHGKEGYKNPVSASLTVIFTIH